MKYQKTFLYLTNGIGVKIMSKLSNWIEKATQGEIERAEWRSVAHGIEQMIDELEKDGCYHSGYRVYLNLAKERGREPE